VLNLGLLLYRADQLRGVDLRILNGVTLLIIAFSLASLWTVAYWDGFVLSGTYAKVVGAVRTTPVQHYHPHPSTTHPSHHIHPRVWVWCVCVVCGQTSDRSLVINNWFGYARYFGLGTVATVLPLGWLWNRRRRSRVKISPTSPSTSTSTQPISSTSTGRQDELERAQFLYTLLICYTITTIIYSIGKITQVDTFAAYLCVL
jgi:hypothetical protein